MASHNIHSVVHSAELTGNYSTMTLGKWQVDGADSGDMLGGSFQKCSVYSVPWITFGFLRCYISEQRTKNGGGGNKVEDKCGWKREIAAQKKGKKNEWWHIQYCSTLMFLFLDLFILFFHLCFSNHLVFLFTRAWVPVNQVFLLSKEPPMTMKSGRKGFDESMQELEHHIQNIMWGTVALLYSFSLNVFD